MSLQCTHRFVIVSLLLCTVTTRLTAQENAASDFSAATADQLFAESTRLSQAGQMTDDVERAIAQRAVQLLSQNNLSDESRNSTWSRLAKLAKPALDSLPDEKRQQIIGLLNQTALNPATASYDAIHARVALMQATGASRESTQELVEQWIQATGIDQLTIEKARWCLEQSLPQKAGRKEFSVNWTGSLSPPRSGQFVFSVCPININKSGPPDETVRHTMRVTIDGNLIVDANSKDWNWQGAPIQLDAGRQVSLRVELTYSSSDNTYGDSPHAFLYWEGPGIAQQIVPSNVLTPSEGQGSGLRAEYRWSEAGQARVAVQQNRNIEFGWATCRDVAPRNPELVDALTQRLWQLATDPAYLTSQMADQRLAHAHPYFRNYTGMEFLSTGQRRQFLQILVQNPRLLQRADQTQILRLYHSLRFGDGKAALDVLGTWMQQRADVAPQIAQDYFNANMRFYRTVGLYLVCRAPNSDDYKVLEDRYLVLPDGRCCLPAAYTLAYCHLMRGTFDAWIDLLNKKLKDESIAGENRVNWLVARAQAQEIRNGGGYRYEIPHVEPLAGTNWLTEAHLLASDATRVRLYREEIARLAAANSERRAKELLQAVTGQVPAQELQEWQTKTESVLKAWHDRRAKDDRIARDAYVKILIERKGEAHTRNDQEAVARYDMLLESAGGETK